jgi:hypothetical protein
MRKKINLSPFEIKTFKVNTRSRRFTEVNLLEKPLPKR